MKSVNERIQELEDAKEKRAELKSDIAKCDMGICLLQKKNNITRKKPWVQIVVNDDYLDGDYWARCETTFHQLSPEMIEALINIFEAKRKTLKTELDKLEKRYHF